MEKTEKSYHIKTFITLLVAVGLLIFSLNAQVFPCPHCGGGLPNRLFCAYCGHDGRVTLYEYLY